MLPQDTIKMLARQLYDARKRRVQVPHFTKQYPEFTIDDGYAIQREWVALEIADGRSIKGRKIGLTSRAMQQASQITEPDFAPLMDDMFFEAGGDIPFDRFIAPRVEVELAFVLERPLKGPGITLFDVLSSTAYVVPAVEIIDARIEQYDSETRLMRKVGDTISDFAANAGVVLGGRPVKPMDVDLRWIGAILHRNGVIEETGLAAGVLNHPGNGVAWLANKIARYDEQINAGDIVLAGSFTRPAHAGAGDALHLDYVAARFDFVPLRVRRVT
ncbi:2-oxohept-3-enedioate hydratase [Paraburkholderia sp. BL23I1N1]|nr:2-oxohept-3-enedioate hydratase [Paraburkholderia sp. BL23I1N1]